MGKRLFDAGVAGLALLLLGLPMLLIALWVRLDSPGPALYRQERVGRWGRPFRIHKFRTMHLQAEAQFPLTLQGDGRITRAGHWLRRRRIDELPQLIDVLSGRMSLVGPRPELPQYVSHYPEALRGLILSVRPGITDPASLAHRDEDAMLSQSDDPQRHYIEQVLPTKLRMQADYIRRATWASDLRVLWRTAAVLWGRQDQA